MTYTGWRLTESSREMLLKRFPPRYPDVIAHHITLSLGKGAPEHATIKVIGYVTDGVGLEALLVSVNGSSVRGSDNTRYHITWSIDRAAGYKPVHSNRVISENKSDDFGGWTSEHAIDIETEGFWVDNNQKEHVRIDSEEVVRAKARCEATGYDPNFIGTKTYPNFMLFCDEQMADHTTDLDKLYREKYTQKLIN